jgi:hypothetical protein
MSSWIDIKINLQFFDKIHPIAGSLNHFLESILQQIAARSKFSVSQPKPCRKGRNNGRLSFI